MDISAKIAGEGPDDRHDEFEKLALEHLGALYHNALRLTRNPADAEDLVQDACLYAYRFFHQFRPGTSFRAWVFRIQRNHYINWYRRSRRRPTTVALDGVPRRAMDAERSMTRTAIAVRPRHAERMSRRLEEALADLTEDLKIALVLAYVEELRYQEIAEIMNWPIGTLMSRLHRSRKKLRNRIEDRREPLVVARRKR